MMENNEMAVTEQPAPYTCKHGCERDLIIQAFTDEARRRIATTRAELAAAHATIHQLGENAAKAAKEYAAQIEALRAERDALREDAERWRAFFGSERFYVMGAAGFDWDNAAVREPRDEKNWLHFTLSVWDRHPAGSDEQGVQGRAMLLSYVDYLRRAALTEPTDEG